MKNLDEIKWKLTLDGYSQLQLQELLPEDDEKVKSDMKHKGGYIAKKIKSLPLYYLVVLILRASVIEIIFIF